MNKIIDMVNQSIHILGGAGGMGRWFIEKIFHSHEPIYCYDVNEKALIGLPHKVKCYKLDSDTIFDNYKSNFQNNDWILCAVPPNKLELTLQNIVPFVKEGTLVVSLTSVQEPAIQLLKKKLPDNCVSLGCHPLFGHTISSPAGQIVALTEYNEQILQHKKIRDYLIGSGLILTYLKAADHDQFMGLVQALTHFSLLTFAATISKNNFHPSELFKLKTPNFQFLYAFASRVLKISPTTTGAIQWTKQASEIRRIFIETAQHLHNEFELSENIESCANVIEVLRNPLTGAEIDEGTEIAALAIDGLQRFEELLYRYKMTGNPFIFRHRITNKIHVVRISTITHDEVFYEESTKIIKSGLDNKFAIGLTDTARNNYKKIGKNLPPIKQGKIKKRNMKLLSAEELKRFYKNDVLPIAKLHIFKNPHGLRDEYFENWLPLLVRGLHKCEFVNAYRERNEVETVSLVLIFNSTFIEEEIVEKVRKITEEQKLHLTTRCT